jgi:uncharacterized protein (TIGR02996 family)
MRKFIFTEGKSNKFWNIDLQGRRCTVQFGKVGTAGQTQRKEFPSEPAARKAHDKLIAEKLAKGYQETTAAAPAPAASAPPPGQAAATPATPSPAPAAVERTFVCGTDKSLKFWNIALQGNHFTVRFGKVGTAGQTQPKQFKDEAAAKKEHDKLIAEKVGKGYAETTPAPAPARGSDSVRDALETAIRDDPDDLAAHSALADHLQEHGDPRGEFIAVQLALEDPTRTAAQRKKLQQQEQKLFWAHGREWLGPTLDASSCNWDKLSTQGRATSFRRGWLWAMSFENRGDDDEYAARVFQALTATPEARFLHDLTIDRADEDSLKVLTRATFAPFLRKLHLGEEPGGTHTGGEGLAVLASAFGRLESLLVYAHLGQDDAARLFAAPLPALRELEVCCTWHYPLDVLAKNRTLTRLRRVLFYPHMREGKDRAAYLNAAGLRALGASKHLTALAELTFQMWDGGDAAADALVETGLLFRLERLDLGLGNLTDAGTQTLARALASRPHRLRFLDLSSNAVTQAGLDAFRAAAGVEVVCTGSHAPGSTEYLAYEGDVE